MRLHTGTDRVCLVLGLCVLIASGAFGCSSADEDDPGASGGSGGSGGSSGSAGTGGGAGTGAGTSFETFTIETTPYPVPKGAEVFFCQNFANPFGKNVEVIESESVMTPGSHHMFVFYEPGASDGSPQPCSGLEFQRAVHGAQTPENKITYPEGVGRSVKTEDGLRVMAHYLNTTGADIEANIRVDFRVVPEGTVEHQAGALFLNNFAVQVEPNSPGSATKTCSVPYDVELINVVSHMHMHGTHFVATTSDGQTLYETNNWDEPQANVFDPPLSIKAGTEITFSCQYQNPTGSTLTFGDSAQTNEMCILSGTYFPAPDGDTIGCF